MFYWLIALLNYSLLLLFYYSVNYLIQNYLNLKQNENLLNRDFDEVNLLFIKIKKMKNLIIVLSVFLTAINVASGQNATKVEDQKIIYVCPMHSDETNLSSGKCPKCGMDLVKTTEKIDTHALKGSQPMTKTVTKYVCPMDGTTSDKPGKCSKCAMEMVKTTEKTDTYALKGSQPMSKTVTKYVCSTDGTVSDKPGQCSKCGKDLVKVTEKIDLHPQKGSQPTSKVVTKYVCPMDGSTSDEPGKCPKCGMEMTQKEDHKH
ncbi:hypothetical protein CLU83_0810 [Flavobacterium sp. 1]|nr:hypothetical protein CLU83_0810 [Flavobacterium sp. 1]